MRWSPVRRPLMPRLEAFAASGVFLALLAPSLAAGAAPETSGYRMLPEIQIGGEGGWDYVTVDPAARRVYVTHSTRVVVLDADKGTVAGEIADLSGIHGVALAPDLGRGFISNGRSSTVTVFDLKKLTKLGEVKTGENPDAILYDPPTHRVFAFNGRSHDATVFEGATGKVAGTIALGGKPEFATSDLKGAVYVNVEDTSEVVRIDPKKLAVTARWPLKPCEEPTGMAIDRKHRRLFVGCSNRLLAVVDGGSGRVITTLPIGEGVDGTAFDPETGFAFTSNGGGDGTLTVVHEDSPDKFHVVENVATRRGARTIALDEKTHSVFLPTAQFGPAPAPTAEQPRPRPTLLPNTFVVLHLGR